jgi:hypothetical protein
MADYQEAADIRNAYKLFELVVSEHTSISHHASARETKYMADET